MPWCHRAGRCSLGPAVDRVLEWWLSQRPHPEPRIQPHLLSAQLYCHLLVLQMLRDTPPVQRSIQAGCLSQQGLARGG